MNDYPADPPRDAIADSDRVYPGDGIAPFPQIVAALDKAGFSGVVSLELFNETYWQQDALTVAKTGLEKTKQALTT
jgi:2-keto-myo-inositol isomerase